MAQAQAEQIKTIFNNFDKDKSGTIELSQLREVAEALGEKLPEDQLSDIVKKLDTNGDGKISLDQFTFWWTNGLKGKLGELVYLKAKSLKMTEAFFNQFEKAGVDLTSFEKESEVDMMSFSLSCGEIVEDCIELDATLMHRGDRFIYGLKELKEQKGLTWLNEKSANIIIILPCTDAHNAKEEMTNLLKELSSTGMFPFLDGLSEGGQQNPYFNLKLEPIEQKLILHIQIKSEFMKLFSDPLNKFDTIDALFDEDFYFCLKGNFCTNFNLEDLLEGSNLIEILLKGFYINISGEAPNSVIMKYRQLMEKSGSTDSSIKFMLSLLMKNAFIKLKLKSPTQVEKFFEKIGIKGILNECPNLSDLLEQISLVPELQEMKFNAQSPKHFMYQMVKTLKNNINSGIELHIQRGQSLFSLKTSCPGAHKLFNIVFNEV